MYIRCEIILVDLTADLWNDHNFHNFLKRYGVFPLLADQNGHMIQLPLTDRVD